MWKYVSDARRLRALRTLGVERESGGLACYECQRVKQWWKNKPYNLSSSQSNSSLCAPHCDRKVKRWLCPCVCPCLHACVHVCMGVLTCKCVCVCVCVCVFALWLWVCWTVHVCPCVHMLVGVHTCKIVCVCLCVCVGVCVCVVHLVSL